MHRQHHKISTLILLVWMFDSIKANGQEAGGAFAIDEAYIYYCQDFNYIRYHNLSFLPPEFLISGAIGAYVPFFRSGDDYSMGTELVIRTGTSLTLEETQAFNSGMYWTMRCGLIGENSRKLSLGYAAGLGIDYYNYNNGTLNGPSFITTRPAIFGELFTIKGKLITFIRITSVLPSQELTRQFISVGGYFRVEL